MTLYAELMEDTGKAFSIESAHWGICTHDDNSGCPSQEWCPYNWYLALALTLTLTLLLLLTAPESEP